MNRLSRENAKKILEDVPYQKAFKLHLNTSLGNLRELAEALDVMSEQTFSHHVTKERNDFAEWISDAVGDAKLAKDVQKQISKEKITRIIQRRLLELEIFRFGGRMLNLIDFLAGIILGIMIGVLLISLL